MESEEKKLNQYSKYKIKRDKSISNIEKERNLICLSENIKNKSQSLRWKCKNCGRECNSRLRGMEENKTICIRCRRKEKINNLENERGIICLSTEIEDVSQKLKWKCKLCSFEWSTNMNNIINNNTGCKKCSIGKFEQMVKKIFESMFSVKLTSINNLNILKYKNHKRLQIDGYNESLKLGFECNSDYHYDENHYFHNPTKKIIKEEKMESNDIENYKKKRFQELQERDLFKKQQCEKNNIILVIITKKEIKNRNYIEKNYKSICELIMKKILEQEPSFKEKNEDEIIKENVVPDFDKIKTYKIKWKI